jgi:hypothetical protein
MLVKGLGLIDVIMGIILIFGIMSILPKQFLIICGIILLAKSSLGMLMDFASWIDFISGLIFLLSILIPIPGFIGIILGILLLQKGFFSFL